jgi:lantibiotic modifying enzyme
MSLPTIEIPSLRPQALGAAFPGTELPDLPTALGEVQRWIDSAEELVEGSGGTASRWHAWPDRPEFQPIYGPVSLNTGASGIAWYSLAAADSTGDAAHVDRARRAAAFVTKEWRAHIEDTSLDVPGIGLGHYGGLSGIASVFVELADRFPEYRPTAIALLDEILARTGSTGGRSFGWTGANGNLGDGGIVITLADAARRLGEPRYLEAAVTAGLGILSEELQDDHGSYWHGVDASALGIPAEIEIDGFELGNIGIAFVLGKLAVATGDERFRDAAARAADHVASQATLVGDAAVLARIGGTISFGYCTGSSGTIRSFLQVYRATGDERYLEWALRFGRGILRSGVPGRQTPGNTYVFHQCCGSAAVLESFVGLWLETGDALWLEAANAQGDDLLIRSVSDDRGRRWYSESHVLPVGTLKAEVGHQVGASGIALSLLRLYDANRADAGTRPFETIRLPDDPFATSAGR